MQHTSMSAKPDGILEVYSEEVAFIFDKHKIFKIEVSVEVCISVLVITYACYMLNKSTPVAKKVRPSRKQQ